MLKASISEIQDLVVEFWQETIGEAANEEIKIHLQSTREKITNEILGNKTRKSEDLLLLLMFSLPNEHSVDYSILSTIMLLDEEIEGSLAKLKVGIESLATASQLFNLLVEKGSLQNLWSIPYLQEIHKIHFIKNPLAEESQWQNLLYIETLQQQFIKQITATNFNPNNYSDTEKVAILLLSLMINSAVLSKEHLLNTLEQSTQQKNYLYFKGRLFFELLSDPCNPPKKVFISQVTEFLIYRIEPWKSTFLTTVFEKQGQSLQNDLLLSLKMILKMILKKMSLKKSIYPTSLQGWCKSISTYQYQNWPPILIAHNTNRHINHSLNTSASKRILKIESMQPSLVKFTLKNTNEQPEQKTYYFREIRKIFDVTVNKGNHSQQLAEILAKSNHLSLRLTDNHLLLLKWGGSYLALTHKGEFKKNPKQILKKISAIGRHLIGLADDCFIEKISIEDRIQLFREVIEQATSLRNKNDIQYHLRDFNTWLEKQNPSLKILNKESVFSTPSMTDMTVNANLISFDEYQSIKSSIQELIAKYPGHNSYPLLFIILIFGFRLGLRISETIDLKLQDYIYCPTSSQLLIRESVDRKIKTLNANRTIKLVGLLSPEELAFINSFFQEQLKIRKIKKLTSSNQFFFSSSSEGDKLKSRENLKSKLMLLIREVCNDASIMYHHLRHSFASWHFLAASITEFDLDLNNYFDHLPKTKAWLENSSSRKLEHLPTQLKSKKYPYWIAQTIGHGSIKTTIEHYIHSLDIITMLYQNKLDSQYTYAQLANLTNISISTLKKNSKQDNYIGSRLIKLFPELKIKQDTNAILLTESWKAPDDACSCLEPISSTITYYRYMDYLYLNGTKDNKALNFLGFSKKEQKKLYSIFQNNPKFRLRNLSHHEQVRVKKHMKNLGKLYQLNTEKEQVFPRNFEAILDTFASRLYPAKASENDLSIQESYHLVVSDTSSAKILTNFAGQAGIPIQYILRYPRKMKPTNLSKAKRYWKRELLLKRTAKFKELKDNSLSPTGNGRLELVFSHGDDKLKKDHAIYFVLVMLSVFNEFHYLV